MTNVAQIALCTSDLPRTARILVDVLGFVSAGGRLRWGEDAAHIQELPTGDDTSLTMWWLVGRQDFFQIELFHHTAPAQRPRPADWQPSDLGWARFGVSVSDFDRALTRLRTAGIEPLSDSVTVGDSRRICFREPGADVIVEIMEDGSGSPDPALAYVAASVTDLDDARRYFGDALGLCELSPEALHRPEHESLWGLPDAQRECALFRARDVLVEVLRYETPIPRPLPADALLSDQGIMNVALGYREPAAMATALAAAQSIGASASGAAPQVAGGVYLRIMDRLSLEMLLVPPALDTLYGFDSKELAPPGIAFPPEVVDALLNTFHRQQYTDVGVSIDYLIGGYGPPVVLLHGWPQTSRCWRLVAPALAAAGYTVIAPDLPGLGQSDPLPDGYGKDVQACVLRAMVRAVGFDGPIRLVGHDIGGYVAFSWARLFPDEVERLVLVDMSLPGLGLEEAMDVARGGRWHHGFFMTPDVPEMLIAGSEDEFFAWWFERLAGDTAAFPPAEIAAFTASYRGREALSRSFGHYRAHLDDGRVNAAWADAGGRLPMPVAAVGGSKSVGDSLAQSLQPVTTTLTSFVIDGAGHFVAEERPEIFVEHVLEFLGS